MKKLLIIFSLLLILINISIVNADEDKLQRFNNLSIYQHTETNAYKMSLFTSLTKGTWFIQNVFDKYFSNDFETSNYYTLTTFGKYINKKKTVSIRTQIEKGTNFPANIYVGMGIDF